LAELGGYVVAVEVGMIQMLLEQLAPAVMVAEHLVHQMQQQVPLAQLTQVVVAAVLEAVLLQLAAADQVR
jgi:hypothetical protein